MRESTQELEISWIARQKYCQYGTRKAESSWCRAFKRTSTSLYLGVRLWDNHPPRNTHLTLLSWFTLTMSTGGIALLLAVTPHKFHGLITIGTLVFIFDLVLFVLLSTLILTRFIMFPGTFTSSVYHPTESLFIPVCVSSGFPLLADKMVTSPRPSSSPYQPSYRASKSTAIPPPAPGSS